MDLTEKIINKKFNAAGIAFGFSYAKETTLRRLLLTKIAEAARICQVPPRHGWYQNGQEIKFAYPSEITWKEIMKNV